MNETLHEQEPKYFTQFRQHIDKKFEEVGKRFDSQEEQIVKVFEDLTMLTRKVDKIEIDIGIIKGDIVIMKEDLKGKADKEDLKDIKRQLFKLEHKPA